MTLTRTFRIAASVAALIAGYAHFSLYQDGYKDIPIAHIGAQFLLNALSSVLIAAALLAPIFIKAPPLLKLGAPLAGMGWAASSLFAFWMSRTEGGWFGFRDGPGLNPSPEAALSVYPEIAVLVCCAALVVHSLVVRRRAASN
ncbi:hypothetical protein [Ilumatobacter sp.]|uniref:hypothetical protein n=1 Tax=Ilumatobacter sp. TaxID=1967498 RepID=UPI0037509561